MLYDEPQTILGLAVTAGEATIDLLAASAAGGLRDINMGAGGPLPTTPDALGAILHMAIRRGSRGTSN